MVSINFRINYEISKEEINNVLKNIGYENIGVSSKAIKVKDEYLTTEVFIRNTKNGRYHLFTVHGKKYSGTEEYPQLKVFLHYDIKKIIKGEKRHITDRNEKRNMDEINKIEKQFLSKGIGFLEIKDRRCAHTTIELKDKLGLLKILDEEFITYDKWKFRKKLNSSQCTIALFEQENFMHVVCVYAKIKNKEHILSRRKSIAILENILQRVCNDKVNLIFV